MIHPRYNTFRLGALFFAFATFYAVLLAYLFFLQVYQYSFFIEKGNQQWHITVTQLPPRAEIYDRHMNPIAINKDSLAAFIVPKKLTNRDALSSFLTNYFPAAQERLHHNPLAHFMYITRQLTNEQKQLVEREQVDDIQLLNEPSRYYPVASLGTIIGVTDCENNGLFGIELLCNKDLQGTPSTHVLKKDARSGQYYFTKETTVTGADATPVQLTIDSTLQYLCYHHLKNSVDELEAKNGAVIIMDPEQGDVLAMANYPDFDPNNHTINTLEATKNRTITDAYELGSVMKAFFALAALEEKVVAVDEIIDCENKKVGFLEKMPLSTWKAHGKIPFAEVIIQSNNFGTSKVAKRLGIKLYDHYRRCGFGSPTGIELSGEQKGFINPPHKWSKPSLFSLSFGYEIRANLLQLARAFCLISNGGHLVQPRIIMKTPIKKTSEPLYTKETLTTLRSMLARIITEGTAHRAKLPAPYTVLGKTGTANLLVDGAYDRNKNIFTFAGIIENGSYKRVIVTFIKQANRKNIYASAIAVPLFEKVAHDLLIHDHQL